MKTIHSDPDNAPSSFDVVVVQVDKRGPLGLAVKSLAQATSFFLVLPRLLVYSIGRRLAGKDRAFAGASESLGRIPGMRGVYCRQAFYRQSLAECGRDIYFGWQSVFSKPSARIGNNVYIGRRCNVGWADIGAGAMLADGVQILSGGRQHGRAQAAGERHQDQPQEYQRVSIGPGAWLGTNAVIMADVGEGAIVGAGAVVNHPLPPHTVAAGVPARVVRQLREPSAAE